MIVLLIMSIIVCASLVCVYLLTKQSDIFPSISDSSSETPVELQTWEKAYFGFSGNDVTNGLSNRRDGRGYSIIQSSDGGYAMTGYATTDTSSMWDILLVKVDSEGNLQWEKTYGCPNDDFGYSLIQSSDSCYVIAGWTNSLRGVGGQVYLIKTDAQGNLLWNKTYNGLVGNSIVESSDHGYVVAGYTYLQETGYTIYLVKTDSSGNVQWTKTIKENNLNVFANCIIKSSKDDSYIVAGYTSNSTQKALNPYLAKIDGYGNITWSKRYTEAGHFLLNSVVESSSGDGYVLTGDSSLIKTDEFGKLLWNKSLGNATEIHGHSIVRSSDGGYLIAGYATAPPLGPVSIYGVYMVKTDESGNILWTKTYGGWGYDFCYSVVKAFDGGYAAVGYTTSDPYSKGGESYVYVVKTDASGNVQS